MEKRLFIGVISWVLLTACYQPERNCESFKTGEFTFEYEVNGEIKTSTFSRTEKYSIEYYENVVDTASVRWLNGCEFILQPSNKETPIHYKILSTTPDSYTFEYGLVGKSNKAKGTAFKTNE
ncbi:MAG: hypothetical protein NWQ38_10215 [Cellulophaga sp.]|nr:hypothetical protein [Cellulophaga sp.]